MEKINECTVVDPFEVDGILNLIAFSRPSALVKSPLNSLPLSESKRSARQPASRSSVARGGRAWRSALRSDCSACPPCRPPAPPRHRRRRRRSRELPDRALDARQAADEEAVDPDQLAGPGDVDVALWAGVSGRLVGSGVAGDQPQALGAGVEAVAAEHLPDAVGRDDNSAPLRRRPAWAPRPGWPSAKATILSSTIFESWLGIRGARRSLGRSISRPWRSTWRFQA